MLRYVTLLVAAIVGYSLLSSPTPTASNADLVAIRQGRWALGFVVLPDCPACEQVVDWLGQARVAQPELGVLLICPWLTDDLQAASEGAGLPLAVDDRGRFSAGLGVQRAPTVVFLLDGGPIARLDWPFTEQELMEALAELAAAPREGPWRHLGETVPLGTLTSLDGRRVDLDELPGPFLLSFFNPLCPPCWEALPVLVELGEGLSVVLVVSLPEALSEDETESLGEAGLVTVWDEDGRLAQALAVRVSPTHVVVDREGVIRWVHEGTGELEELRGAILTLLDEDGKDERKQDEGGT